jgi:hypothetical protein
MVMPHSRIRFNTAGSFGGVSQAMTGKNAGSAATLGHAESHTHSKHANRRMIAIGWSSTG